MGELSSLRDIVLLGNEGDFDSDDLCEDREDCGMVTSALDATTPDELLTPIAKLEKYIDSDNVFNRQIVARGLLDTFRYVVDSPEEKETVVQALGHMADDVEPSVRAELMEQIPHIAMFCQDNRDYFPDTVSRCIIPMITRYLLDTNVQVRKTSQAAVLVLLEQELIEKSDVENHICPVLLHLTGPDSTDDYRTEAVALLTKMAPLLGSEITVRVVLPRFSELCTDSLFHIRKVCAANFGDICSVVGSKHTEDILLEKFEYLCEDGVWGVRKACAECFTQVSLSVSHEKRKEDLAPVFVRLLCDQSRWVRMAAFQALGPFISTFADPGRTGLALNQDASHSVKFDEDLIRTPEVETTTVDNQNKRNRHHHHQKNQKHHKSPQQNHPTFMEIDENTGTTSTVIFLNKDASALNDSTDEANDLEEENIRVGVGELAFSLGDEDHSDKKMDEYNTFQYWRNPLPTIDLKVEQLGTESDDENDIYTSTTEITIGESEESHNDSDRSSSENASSAQDSQPAEDSNATNTVSEVTEQVSEVNLSPANEQTPEAGTGVEHQVQEASVENPQTASVSETEEGNVESAEKKLHTASVNEVTELTETVPNIGSEQVISQTLNEKATNMTFVNGVVQDMYDGSETESDDSSYEDKCRKQDVIPSDLLEHYLSMIDPLRAQAVDTEIAKHCAFSLPGVAYTLGRRNWHCIKDIYETLASDMQWKVRRTLAFSIHEMAVILGDQLTSSDLVPVFNGFLRDLDEVRIGVLKHLADFLKLLKPELRKEYLIRLTDFLQTDNQRNWRFRQELAVQLILLCDLYQPSDVIENIFPIAIALAGDRVAEVRILAYKLLSVTLKKVNEDGALYRRFIDDIVNRYAQSTRWFGRQTFAHLCQNLLAEEAITNKQFVSELLPQLIKLSTDNVPNVRIAVARLLAQHIIPSEYFNSKDNPEQEPLQKVIAQLREDSDRDVRFYATCSNNAYINFSDMELDGKLKKHLA
ncbi:serine/threonine-protein phosphatase 4 regulatory subunit 1-like isoform X3 [Ptychodera flava]|uniref:serine/threonine-protein phosphatase 4 regulatory subunit 1-like isoform X3 n=1 Tax=Ptychodera flava TaxID=63121 RepID=UPI003969FAAC